MYHMCFSHVHTIAVPYPIVSCTVLPLSSLMRAVIPARTCKQNLSLTIDIVQSSCVICMTIDYWQCSDPLPSSVFFVQISFSVEWHYSHWIAHFHSIALKNWFASHRVGRPQLEQQQRVRWNPRIRTRRESQQRPRKQQPKWRKLPRRKDR